MYYLVMQQDDEGCDFTIGCGTRVSPLKSVSLEAARAEVPGVLEYHGVGHSERRLKTCYIVQFVEEYDYNAWLNHRDDATLAQKAAEKEAEERETYRRLQAKFG